MKVGDRIVWRSVHMLALMTGTVVVIRGNNVVVSLDGYDDELDIVNVKDVLSKDASDEYARIAEKTKELHDIIDEANDELVELKGKIHRLLSGM